MHAAQHIITPGYRKLTVLKLSDGGFVTTHSNLATTQESQSLYASINKFQILI